MIKVIYKAEVFEEDGVYVGLSPELNVSSFGDTPQEATDSLQEAVELCLEGCESLWTLEEVLEESGFKKEDDTWRLRERITEEKVATLA